MNRKKLNEIMDLVDEILTPSGFECLEVEWNAYDETLRLYIDRPGGVDMQACVQATDLLRDVDGIAGKDAGSYTLEVSSPGLERPLRRRRHFAKFLDSEIAVSLTEKCGDRRKGIGHLRSVSEDGLLTLDVEAKEWTFPLESVAKAHVVHRWGS